MFADRAYDDISIGEIAQAAGISKGLLYHYFPSKRAFFAAAVKHAAQELLAATALPDLVPGTLNLEAMRRSLDAYLRYVEERAPSYRFLLRGGDPELTAIVDDTRKQFLDRILLQVGTTVDDAVIRSLARGWVGFVECASLDWLEHGDMTRAELTTILTQACFGVFSGAMMARPHGEVNSG